MSSFHNITHTLKEAGLLGSRLIPSSHFEPTAALQIIYPHRGNVSLGNKLTMQQTVKEPTVDWIVGIPERPSRVFTLLMVDADAPMHEKPSKSPYLHWCQTGLFAEGGPQFPSLAPYACPSPEPGTGPHRFVFLLYREPLPHEACHHSGVELPGGTLKREKFPIEEFVRNSKLDLVSADFFYSEHEKQ